MKISEFYKTEYVDYASYDNIRKYASAIDGMKNSSRKVLSTILDKKITQEMKVSQLASKMAEHTEYLHGDSSTPIVTMAQDFAGTNNIPLLVREGNFGTRFVPEASAPRYIKTHGSNDLWNLFDKNDDHILIQQYFEGARIEPKFYLPSLPLLLVNGNRGVSSGFKQLILNRNPELLKKHIINVLEGRTTRLDVFKPYFEGFMGEIRPGKGKNKWEILGTIERKSSTKIVITELPVGTPLKRYIKNLQALEEKKFIKSFKDRSNPSTKKFLFEVNMGVSDLKNITDEDLLQKLGLITKVTESFTSFDENNRLRLFKSAEEVFEYYMDVKLRFMQKRKDYITRNIEFKIARDESKVKFIQMIVNDELVINKRKKDAIVKDLEKIKDIITVDDSYDYLLNMSIQSLTVERIAALKEAVAASKKELAKVKSTTIQEMWLEDLGKL